MPQIGVVPCPVLAWARHMYIYNDLKIDIDICTDIYIYIYMHMYDYV